MVAAVGSIFQEGGCYELFHLSLSLTEIKDAGLGLIFAGSVDSITIGMSVESLRILANQYLRQNQGLQCCGEDLCLLPFWDVFCEYCCDIGNWNTEWRKNHQNTVDSICPRSALLCCACLRKYYTTNQVVHSCEPKLTDVYGFCQFCGHTRKIPVSYKFIFRSFFDLHSKKTASFIRFHKFSGRF